MVAFEGCRNPDNVTHFILNENGRYVGPLSKSTLKYTYDMPGERELPIEHSICRLQSLSNFLLNKSSFCRVLAVTMNKAPDRTFSQLQYACTSF